MAPAPGANVGLTPMDRRGKEAADGCGSSHIQGRSIVEYMFSGGVLRSYRIYVPQSYDPSTPAPLVLGFHGLGSNALEQEYYTNLRPQADLHGFVLVSPNAVGTPAHWNYLGRLAPNTPDDYRFVNDLIDHLQGELCIDATRVYATGMSDGGTMAAILGCKLNGRIAAIAPVAGAPYLDLSCYSAGSVPLITFHGTADQFWPFDGGTGLLGLPTEPVEKDMHDWAVHNSCDLTLQNQTIASDVTLETYTNCNANADVELYVIEGGGHTFPGAPFDIPSFGPTSRSIDAAQLIWEFFAAHPKQ